MPEAKYSKVYYAHPTFTYGTLCEKRALEIISQTFPEAKIVNPADYQFITHGGGMEIFYMLLDTCDAIVYTEISGFVTAGVANEIKRALEQGKDVYKLDWRTGEITKINKPPKNTLDIQTTKLLQKTLYTQNIDDTELEQKNKHKNQRTRRNHRQKNSTTTHSKTNKTTKTKTKHKNRPNKPTLPLVARTEICTNPGRQRENN